MLFQLSTCACRSSAALRAASTSASSTLTLRTASLSTAAGPASITTAGAAFCCCCCCCACAAALASAVLAVSACSCASCSAPSALTLSSESFMHSSCLARRPSRSSLTRRSPASRSSSARDRSAAASLRASVHSCSFLARSLRTLSTSAACRLPSSSLVSSSCLSTAWMLALSCRSASTVFSLSAALYSQCCFSAVSLALSSVSERSRSCAPRALVACWASFCSSASLRASRPPSRSLSPASSLPRAAWAPSRAANLSRRYDRSLCACALAILALVASLRAVSSSPCSICVCSRASTRTRSISCTMARTLSWSAPDAPGAGRGASESSSRRRDRSASDSSTLYMSRCCVTCCNLCSSSILWSLIVSTSLSAACTLPPNSSRISRFLSSASTSLSLLSLRTTARSFWFCVWSSSTLRNTTSWSVMTCSASVALAGTSGACSCTRAAPPCLMSALLTAGDARLLRSSSASPSSALHWRLRSAFSLSSSATSTTNRSLCAASTRLPCVSRSTSASALCSLPDACCAAVLAASLSCRCCMIRGPFASSSSTTASRHASARSREDRSSCSRKHVCSSTE
mmetsp:Transcript_10181/g.25149  ORF Transcript_10181/g.25149 Transcript_10181/m.25149 type:complete len:574 (-) Transcript_10181:373-2094(-)